LCVSFTAALIVIASVQIPPHRAFCEVPHHL
jgi:hypothetical protein